MIVICEKIDDIKTERYIPNNMIIEVHVVLDDADGVAQITFYHGDGRSFMVIKEDAQASWDANKDFLTNYVNNSDKHQLIKEYISSIF